MPPSRGDINEENERKLQKIGIPRGITLSKNCSIRLKIKLDLEIIMINLYTKFHFHMFILYDEN